MAPGKSERPPAPVVTDAHRAEIGLCLLFACADGDVSDPEVGALSARFGALLGELVSPFLMHEVLLSEMAELDALGPDEYVAGIAARLPSASRTPALENALRVALADGLSEHEKQSFREAAAALGLPAARAEAMLARAARLGSDVPPWSAAAPPELPPEEPPSGAGEH